VADIRAHGTGRRRIAPPDLIYIDLHLSMGDQPAAFDGLRLNGRRCAAPTTIATEDHNVPTIDIDKSDRRPDLAHQSRRAPHCESFGIRRTRWATPRACHIIGAASHIHCMRRHDGGVRGQPHLNHGAFGALAMGIGTWRSENVLATQAAAAARSRPWEVTWTASCRRCQREGLILAVIAKNRPGGGQGTYRIPRQAASNRCRWGRMTIATWIEAGARAGMVAPAETTFNFCAGVRTRRRARLDAAFAAWTHCVLDEGVEFDTGLPRRLDAEPVRHRGTNPGKGVPLRVRSLTRLMSDDAERQTAEKHWRT